MLPQVALQFCQRLLVGLTQEKHSIRGASQLHQSPLVNQGPQYLATYSRFSFGAPRWSIRVLAELAQELLDLLLLGGSKRWHEIGQPDQAACCACCPGGLGQQSFLLQSCKDFCCHLWWQAQARAPLLF